MRGDWRVGLAAAFLTAGLAGWWWWPAAVPSGPVAPLAAAPWRPDAGEAAAAPAQAPAAPLAAASAAAPPPACPAAVRAWAGQSEAALESLLDAQDVQLRAKVVGLLTASADDFERALGALMAQGRPPTADKWPPLIEAAATTRDSRLVALGAQACSSGLAGPPGCPPGLAQRWAEGEPDNLQAWLALADEAAKRGDAAGVQAALERAAAATDSRTSWGVAQRVLDQPALRDAHPMALLPVAVDLIGIESMAGLAGGSAALRLCSEAAVQAAAHRELCSAVAGVMVGRGRTLMERRLGIAVARRSGWPPERLQALDAEQLALEVASRRLQPSDVPGDRPLTEAQACGLHRQFGVLLAQLRSGDEVQVARSLLDAQGPAGAAAR